MSDTPTPTTPPSTDSSFAAAPSRTERWELRPYTEPQPEPAQDAVTPTSLFWLAKKLVAIVFKSAGDTSSSHTHLSTGKHLHAAKADRERVLLDKLEQELKDHADSIARADRDTLLTRGRLALRTFLKQNVSTLTLSITSDFSLYFRAHLAAGQGTLHLEIFTGPDADPEENTLATLYQGPHQRWALGGTFLETIEDLRTQLTTSSALIGTIR